MRSGSRPPFHRHACVRSREPAPSFRGATPRGIVGFALRGCGLVSVCQLRRVAPRVPVHDSDKAVLTVIASPLSSLHGPQLDSSPRFVGDRRAAARRGVDRLRCPLDTNWPVAGRSKRYFGHTAAALSGHGRCGLHLARRNSRARQLSRPWRRARETTRRVAHGPMLAAPVILPTSHAAEAACGRKGQSHSHPGGPAAADADLHADSTWRLVATCL